jgi:hypothetical protein
MARTQTEDTTTLVAIESTPGVLPGSPTWFEVETEGLSQYGATIETVARRPIGRDRGRQKGTPVSLTSGVGLPTDLTIDVVERFGPSIFYSEFANDEFRLRTTGGVLPPPVASTSTFTIASASAALAAKMVYAASGATTLVYAIGYTNAENNGVHALGADVASTDTTVTVTSTLVVETPPTNADLQVCGVRTDDVTVVINANGTGTITSAADVSNWATLGVLKGMRLHVGGVAANGEDAANAPTFGGTATWFYCRVTAIAGGVISFDKCSITGTTGTSAGGGETIDILFGRFLRDVPRSADSADNRYLRPNLQFETAFPDLLAGTGDGVGYEYAKANVLGETTFDIPLEDKGGVEFTFTGTDTETPTNTRKTNASSFVRALRKTAFGTSNDVPSIATDVISDQSEVCFKSASLTFTNNVSGESCIGTFGPRFINSGLFEANLEAQLLYSSAAILSAIPEQHDRYVRDHAPKRQRCDLVRHPRVDAFGRRS